MLLKLALPKVSLLCYLYFFYESYEDKQFFSLFLSISIKNITKHYCLLLHSLTHFIHFSFLQSVLHVPVCTCLYKAKFLNCQLKLLAIIQPKYLPGYFNSYLSFKDILLILKLLNLLQNYTKGLWTIHPYLV